MGRGALAGPVVAAAVAEQRCGPLAMPKVFPDWWELVTDSKKLTRGRISELAPKIAELAHGIGEASAAEIDRLGITTATRLAMERALRSCLNDERVHGKLLHVLVDGNSNFGHRDWRPVVRGDATFRIIGAASILAKWARDRLMRTQVNSRFPKYGFDRHVGYGTRVHMAALRKHGACEEHRRTFAGVPKDPRRGIIDEKGGVKDAGK